MLPSGGYEPGVVNAALYAPKNKISAPITGKSGVFVIQKLNEVVPPKASDLTQYKNQMKQVLAGKANRGSVEALKKLANVVDSRSDFF